MISFLQHLKNQLGRQANYYFNISHLTINVDSHNINQGESNLVKPSSKSAYEGWSQSIDWKGIVNIIIYAVVFVDIGFKACNFLLTNILRHYF